jgi:hypothetical protein
LYLGDRFIDRLLVLGHERADEGVEYVFSAAKEHEPDDGCGLEFVVKRLAKLCSQDVQKRKES